MTLNVSRKDESAFELAQLGVDVAIVCHDFERSLDFYERVLGLEVATDIEIPEWLAVPGRLAPAAFRHVRLQAGSALIKLMEIKPPPVRRDSGFEAGVRWITFFVRDLDKTLRMINERGTPTYSGPIEGLAGRFATVQDPDGLIIELVQLYEVPSPES
jgi:glyoxylase I family protein